MNIDDPKTPENDDEDFAQDDDLTASIRKGLEELESQQGDDDDFHMDKPLDDASDDAFNVVRSDEAQEMVSKAELGEGKAQKDVKAEDEADKDKGEKTAPESDAEPEKKADSDDDADKDDAADDDAAEAGKEDGAPDMTEAPIADLVKGMPKKTRGEVTRRLGEAEKLLAPFRGREEELKLHGVTPSDVMGRFLSINEMALKTPDQYLDWYSQQINALGGEALEKMDAGLKKIVEARGYKIEKAEPSADDDDDDPFTSDSEREMRRELKQMREEVARLKGGGQPQPGAQPAPAQPVPGADLASQAEQILVTMETEQNPDGSLKRPEFRQVMPLWLNAVQTFSAKEKRAPTQPEMATLYDQIVDAQRQLFGGGAPAKSAADAGNGAVSKDQDAARRVDKARNASKLVDGAGQGASRHLAPPEDAPLEDVVKANYARIFGGKD